MLMARGMKPHNTALVSSVTCMCVCVCVCLGIGADGGGRCWWGGGGGVMFDIVVFCGLLCITLVLSPHWGPVNAEIQVPSVENSELRDVLPLRLRVGQNIATHALPMAGNFLLILALTPEGRPGMSDVPSPVWNLRAVS